MLSLLRSEGIKAIAQKTNYAVGLADAASSGAGPARDPRARREPRACARGSRAAAADLESRRRRAEPSWPQGRPRPGGRAARPPRRRARSRASAACSWSRSPWTTKYSTAASPRRSRSARRRPRSFVSRDRRLARPRSRRGSRRRRARRRPRPRRTRSSASAGSGSACLRAEGGGEVVPERDVLRLFVGVQPRRAGRARQRHDRVPVLAGVAGQLVARQLTLLPACVERMLEHVPALPSRVDPCDHVHPGQPPRRPTPRSILQRVPAASGSRGAGGRPRRPRAPRARPGSGSGSGSSLVAMASPGRLVMTATSCARACAIRIGGAPRPAPKVSPGWLYNRGFRASKGIQN